MSSPHQPQKPADGYVGTLDGIGAGDHDQPYRFRVAPSLDGALSVQHASVRSAAGPARPLRGRSAYPGRTRPDASLGRPHRLT